MKYTFALFIAIGLSVGAAIVRNGDFNDAPSATGKCPTGWKGSASAETQWRFADDDGLTDTTAAVLKLTGKKPAGTLSQTVTLEKGKTYTLSAALKGDGVVPILTLLTKSRKRIVTIRPEPQAPPSWSTYSVAFQAPADTAVLKLSAEGTKGTAAADDIEITPGVKPGAKQAEKTIDTPENIARGKSYTWSYAPNYALCTDHEDTTQLTDGIYTKGYFWTQKSTVGWSRKELLTLTIDLEKDMPISGFSYNTAGGTAGVAWPRVVNVYASVDKTDWYYIGNLFAKSKAEHGAPDETKYNVYRAWSANMPTHGRFIAFLINQEPYCFCDEIEVFKGDMALLAKAPSNVKTSSPQEHFVLGMAQTRMQDDLLAIRAGASSLPAKVRKAFDKCADQITADIEAIPPTFAQKLNTILPICPEHARVYALNAYILRAKGFDKPLIWRNCRWDNLDPIAVPPSANTLPNSLTVEMMRGEVRSDAFNILNPTDMPLKTTLRITGIPFAAKPDLREVIFSDTKTMTPVAAALKPGNGDTLEFDLPAGISKQVWLSFNKPSVSPGTYNGTITATLTAKDTTTTTLTIPVSLVVHDFYFPKCPHLHVGGWDYVNGGGKYYKSPDNLKSNLATMRSIYTDSPWATSAVTPAGAIFDKDGKLLNASRLDYTNWNAWLDLWNNASLYCVFWAVRDTFHHEPMGTPRFNRMVREYVTAWTDQMKTRKLKPSQLVILLVDEPRAHEYDKTIIAWGNAIRQANTGLRVFEDPIYTHPQDAMPDMYAVSDILCPNTPAMAGSQEIHDFFLKQRTEQHKELWLYSCSGPSRLLDPVYYHRVQAWHCFEIGATGSFYWALGCGGGIGDSWHAYAQTGKEYSPYFIGKTDTMHAKQSEGIREGVQDYEYLCMLRKRIAQLRETQHDHPKLSQATTLLEEAPKRVLNPKNSTDKYTSYSNQWNSDNDRTIPDAVRIEILRMLTALK